MVIEVLIQDQLSEFTIQNISRFIKLNAIFKEFLNGLFDIKPFFMVCQKF